MEGGRFGNSIRIEKTERCYRREKEACADRKGELKKTAGKKSRNAKLTISNTQNHGKPSKRGKAGHKGRAAREKRS